MFFIYLVNFVSRGHYKYATWGNVGTRDKVDVNVKTNADSKRVDYHCWKIKAIVNSSKKDSAFHKDSGPALFNTAIILQVLLSEISLMLTFIGPRFVTHQKKNNSGIRPHNHQNCIFAR